MIRVFPPSYWHSLEIKEGHGLLKPYTAVVHEEKNGDFSLTMTVPTEDTLCKNESVVIAPTPYKDNNEQYSYEPFRIVNTDVAFFGEKKVFARHLFYDIEDNYIDNVHSVEDNASDALEKMLSSLQYESNITGTTDLTSVSTAYWEMLNPVEALIGTQENSFVNRWGGVLKRTGNTFKITNEKPQEVNVRYGYNLEQCGLQINFQDVVTRIVPTGLYDSGAVLRLPELCVDSEHIGDYQHPKIRRFHYGEIRNAASTGTNSIDEEALQNTYEKLREAAHAEFAKGIDLPQASGKISIIDLTQMREYKNAIGITEILPFAPIKIWLDAKTMIQAEMQEYEFDALSERYQSITVGMPTQYAGERLQQAINTLGSRVEVLEQAAFAAGKV